MYKIVRTCKGNAIEPRTVARYRSYLRAAGFVAVVSFLNYTRFPWWLASAIRYHIEREKRP